MYGTSGYLLITQGGGPTPVINSSLKGIIQTALKSQAVNNVYGALYGVEGILEEQFIDLRQEINDTLAGLT